MICSSRRVIYQETVCSRGDFYPFASSAAESLAFPKPIGIENERVTWATVVATLVAASLEAIEMHAEALRMAAAVDDGRSHSESGPSRAADPVAEMLKAYCAARATTFATALRGAQKVQSALGGAAYSCWVHKHQRCFGVR